MNWREYCKRENIEGKRIWICDYRLNGNCDAKPIRAVKPTYVEITSNENLPANKRVYYSDYHFRPVNGKGIMTSKIIAPFDNTGYRGYTGIALNVFENKEECIEFYREQLRKAKEQYQNKFDEIQKSMNDKFDELDELSKEFN